MKVDRSKLCTWGVSGCNCARGKPIVMFPLWKPPATAVYTAYIMAGVSYSSVAYGLIGGLYHSWAKAIVIALANWVL